MTLGQPPAGTDGLAVIDRIVGLQPTPEPATEHPMTCGASTSDNASNHTHRCTHPAIRPDQTQGRPTHRCWCGVGWYDPQTPPTNPGLDKARSDLECATNALGYLLLAIDRVTTASATVGNSVTGIADLTACLAQLQQRAADTRAVLDDLGLSHLHQPKEPT